jgi:hypothetical protein
MLPGGTRRGFSSSELLEMIAAGDEPAATLAAALLDARRALREESIRCAEIAATVSHEAAGAIREAAQLRENVYPLGHGHGLGQQSPDAIDGDVQQLPRVPGASAAAPSTRSAKGHRWYGGSPKNKG